jgi:isopenicillin-N N-acyltransferase-like protein
MTFRETPSPAPIIHTTPPPFVEVSGTYRDIGRQIGEACREQVQHSVENGRKLLSEAYGELRLTWDQARIQAYKYLPFSEESFPEYLEEMRGLAEGASVSFEDIFILNAMEGVTMDALHLSKCTNFAVSGERSEQGKVLIGHNEDWIPDDENDVYIIHASPQNDVPFLAITYGGLLPNIGFNAAGIAQCCNTVRANDARVGVPRIVVSRAVLSARNITEAVQHTIVPNRAAGYNHLLAHESGELYNIEVSAKQFAILHGEADYVVHTNHYLGDRMRLIDTTPNELVDTQIRYHRARRLLLKTPTHTVHSFMEIQRDHFNHPYSICNHTMHSLGTMHAKKTITAFVIDLTARKLHLTWGNPCNNTHFSFALNC